MSLTSHGCFSSIIGTCAHERPDIECKFSVAQFSSIMGTCASLTRHGCSIVEMQIPHVMATVKEAYEGLEDWHVSSG